MLRGFSPHDADVDGVRIHARVGGSGPRCFCYMATLSLM
jgi:hypothetical protein